MSLVEAVALTYLVSSVIVIGVFPMLLSDPPAWLVQDDPYEARWESTRGSVTGIDVFDPFSHTTLPGGHGCQRKTSFGADHNNDYVGIQNVAV